MAAIGAGSAASPGNGAIAIGMRCAPAPVISIDSCALALPQKTSTAASAMKNRMGTIIKSVPQSELKFRNALEKNRNCRVSASVLRPEFELQIAREEIGPVGFRQR